MRASSTAVKSSYCASDRFFFWCTSCSDCCIGMCSLGVVVVTLGYPQLPTPMTCDNSCAVGIAKKSFTQKRSKTIDMRYHWIQDQIILDNFTVTWAASKDNLADVFTKAHPVSHHILMMKTYLVPEEGMLIS